MVSARLHNRTVTLIAFGSLRYRTSIMVKSVNASVRSARSVHLTRSPPPLPTIANDAVPSSIRPRFSLASLAAIYPNSFVEGHSNTERQAAARALLRHNTNIDGTHFHMRKRGGLHPSYIAFNSYTSADEKSITQEELVEASLQDVFDAVSQSILSTLQCANLIEQLDCDTRPSRWRDFPSYPLPWL